MKTVIKRFVMEIPASSAPVSKTFELDKNIELVKGIMLSANKDNLLYYRGAQKIEINKEEVFPEGYSSKHLMNGINVPCNNRYYEINKQAGNRNIRIDYTDTDDGVTAFSPYLIEICLLCEQNED